MTSSDFLNAARGLPHDRVPVWFMRQAGRALAEYRAIRENHSFAEVVATPELACEVTMQPVRRYGVDAAILFSDIVTPVEALGVGLEIRAGIGPVIDEPFRTRADIDRLRALDAEEDLAPVLETVRLLVKELGDTPLIGFAGAPFTLASYLIEGGPSKNYARTKAMMKADPESWDLLMTRLAQISLETLRGQVSAGARAVQLFDSWAGACSPQDYAKHVLPYSKLIFNGLRDLDVPRIHFGVASGELLGLMAEAGPDVVGVDWRVPLDAARTRIPEGTGMQGNLDSTIALAGVEHAKEAARDVLRRSAGHPHYIFNLGHGVLPATDPGVLREVVDLVHAEGVVNAA